MRGNKLDEFPLERRTSSQVLLTKAQLAPGFGPAAKCFLCSDCDIVAAFVASTPAAPRCARTVGFSPPARSARTGRRAPSFARSSGQRTQIRDGIPGNRALVPAYGRLLLLTDQARTQPLQSHAAEAGRQ